MCGVIHHGQRLPLGLESSDDLARVHADLEDLERDGATHRLGLLGAPNGTEAALANHPEQAVAVDRLAAIRTRDRGGEVFGGVVEQVQLALDLLPHGALDGLTGEPGCLLIGRQVGRLLEQPLDELQIGRRHKGAPPRSASCKKVRMKRHSRSTVDSETPRTSAVSRAVSPVK